mmetsp:Transcript_118579/g.242332  ORF Transcript_118579/g.242332 Transcript_118579/m.242332 type:complete len:383 (+) Transcript_118579:314-1462(+)
MLSMYLLNGETVGADISLCGGSGDEFLALALEGLLGGSCGALLGQQCGLVGFAVLLCLLGHASLVGGVHVELLEGGDGLEGVGLGLVPGRGGLGGVEDRLDLVGVDDTGDVGVGHGGGGDGLSVLSVDGVEGVEGGLRPDAEASHVSAGGQLEEVQPGNAAELDTGEVAEGELDSVVLGVDDEGTTSHGVSSVTHLTLTGTDALGVSGLFDVVEGTDGGKNVLGGGGLLGGFDGGVEDQGNLWDLVDDVSAGHDQGRDGGSGQGGGHGVSLLADVDLLVPLAPGLGGCEHASPAAHVTEGSLSGSGGTSSSDAGNTGDGTPGTPRGGGDLLSGTDRDGVGLSLVLVHVGVDELNDVGTEGSRHDGGESGLSGLVSREGEDTD